MTADWVQKSLGEVVSLQRGHDLPTQKRVQGDVPIMGSAGITGWHNEVKMKAPGVVVGRSGNSMGEVHYCNTDYWPLNTCLFVTDFKGNDERYIYLLLNSINFDQFNSGSAQKSLNRNAVYPYEVILPESKDEQSKIANLVFDFTSKIELNRQINQTLESISQAIFKSWFVDFDPVKAKITALESGENAEGITHAAMRAISGKTDDELDKMEGRRAEDYAKLKATAGLFPAAMQDSELGEVPEGWRGGTLNKLIKITSGKRPNEKSGKTDFEFVVPLIGASSITGYVKETLYDKAILVIGRVGTHGVVQRVMPPSFPSDNTLVIQSEYYEFIYQILKIIDYKSLNVGSTQPLITQKSIKNYMIVVPKKEVLMDFENIVSGLFRKVAYDNQEIKKLATIRDTLLPKFMSGDIQVKGER